MVVVKFLIPNRAVTTAKNFKTKYGPLSISRYVSILYGMKQLYTNKVAALINVSVVTGIDLVGLVNLFVKQFRAECRI